MRLLLLSVIAAGVAQYIELVELQEVVAHSIEAVLDCPSVLTKAESVRSELPKLMPWIVIDACPDVGLFDKSITVRTGAS